MTKDTVEKFMKLLPEMTKHEADLIEEVLKWDQEKRIGFMIAKRFFEENIEDKEIK